MSRLLAMLSRWPATVAVACGIVALSEVPPTALPATAPFPAADKLVHLTEYLVLGALLFRSLRYEMAGHSGSAAIITVCVGTAFGLLDEWHQACVGRTADAWDVLADGVGLACGVLFVAWLTRWRFHDGR